MTIRIIHAILAGLQILTAGSALADVIGERWAALIALMVGAVQAGVAAYDSGSVLAQRTEKAPDSAVEPRSGAGEG